ncbi:Polymyxin resistance protein ArnT, undecaprenyl phosphate-alpha-L-Ara4N transferase; Melittin resistance protein PqaB [Olavius algarvensis Delta 1 endosymbiont]|nr:Polymyxin resistance protein ArnT, undecaprenyl phosphate-alpha-L-Ara4N transferase; Melittin resistance protein PqaB [Olavius algarvensis Delta 1 endosymbiont]
MSRFNHSASHILMLSLLCILLFFFRMGGHSLWDIDEGMHAATSKDMVLSNDWITPTYNGENFYDKPALFNWFVAVSFLIFGFTEFAARLPAALLGWGCVMTTYYLGREMFNPRTGFLSAVILATSIEFIVLARFVVHDISLAFFITLALALFYMGYQRAEKRRLCFLIGYAALGMAALAKGPVGLLLPVMVIGLFLILRKKIGFVKEMQIGWGLLLVMVVAAPWYTLISLENPDYFEYFFLKQNFGSFFDDVHSRHPEPFYYYLPLLFGGFFPWSLFLPYTLYDAVRKKITSHGEGILYILIWFGAIFVFFSLASSKLGTYILPLFPALSLLVGVFLHELTTTPNRASHKAALISCFSVLAIFAGALIFLFLYPPVDLATNFGFNLAHLKSIAMLAIGISALAFFAILKRKYAIFLFSNALLMVVIVVCAFQYIMPAIDAYRSTKGPALKLDEILEPGENLIFYDRVMDSALFYTDRKATEIHYEELRTLMTSNQDVYCIISREDWEEEVTDGRTFASIFMEYGDRLIIRSLSGGK